MQLGMVGLGRMGGNIVRRLTRNGHRCVVFDQNPAAIATLVKEGASGGADLKALVAQLEPPRAVWVMLPAGEITERTVTQLSELMDRGDIIIDGGNSFYKDDVRRARALQEKGIHYIDCGTRRTWSIASTRSSPPWRPAKAILRSRPGVRAAIRASSAAMSTAARAVPDASSR
jgi:6-phosphogluconate dehydrogenase (decarboxylating)